MADAPKQQQIAMDAAVARTLQEKESGGAKKSRYGAKPSLRLAVPGVMVRTMTTISSAIHSTIQQVADMVMLVSLVATLRSTSILAARLRKDSRTIRESHPINFLILKVGLGRKAG